MGIPTTDTHNTLFPLAGRTLVKFSCFVDSCLIFEAGRRQHRDTYTSYADWRYICIFTCVECVYNVSVNTFKTGLADRISIRLQNVPPSQTLPGLAVIAHVSVEVS